MRLRASAAWAAGMALCVSGCIDSSNLAERTAAGALLGAGLGAAVGATFAVNPGMGALIGTVGGGIAGAATAVLTADPAPSYGPIPARDTAGVPGFYDSWPPFYHLLPVGAETPPPLPHPG